MVPFPAGAKDQIAHDVEPFLKTVNRIEDPRTNDFFSTDCVSCHKSTSLTRTLKPAAGLRAVHGAKWLMYDGSLFKSPEGMTTAIRPYVIQDGLCIVINFGYFEELSFRK